MRLDRQRIIGAALTLIDEAGLDGLSTHRLAAALAVKQPALYWHFPTKTALLEALAQEMLDRYHTRPLPEPGEGWREFLFSNARSFRRALLSVRDGARLHSGTHPDIRSTDIPERQIRFLIEAGFSPEAAAYSLIAISRYTVGAVLEQQADAGESEQSDPESEGLPGLLGRLAAAGPEPEFEFGLAALVGGIESRLATTPSGSK
ncbi:TetR/AcrR family transcriptional regulator C-terminal domain-containing protein [Mycobacterium sp. 21AC1]|uniref:TetR/AcrR family transcriptional regulator C-terminal domain-containing protein n=1 Tax=[Mycobacterium] appelbergii TaxID=2939269 RepID=UPI002938DF92|nr:TetR/AcrR family transcriptional regulator C-terminal domain-containing protein [Mycobacterium sp. 21AC1]MDV3123632.1 TetR/AcrR family transcriptional regulator C-terminal domain-containing protein [Mycobacterium sp. 21AC1]